MRSPNRSYEVFACDLCYARKVKCDRESPCHNCVNAKANCCRTRPERGGRRRRRPDEQLQSLADRLSHLEDSLGKRNTNPGEASTKARSADAARTIDSSMASAIQQPSNTHKRKRNCDQVVHSQGPVTPLSDNDVPHEKEARAFIEKELSHNDFLSVKQRGVLEASLSLVNQLSQAPSISPEGRGVWDRNHCPAIELTRSEILHVVLACNQTISTSPSLSFPEFLPPKTIKRMGMALLDGTADEQTALQYKAIIHFKAAVIFHTYHAFTSDASSLNKSVQDQIMENLHASLAALDSIKFLTQPSLSLLQALLTGVIVMEVLGDIPGRSALTVSAARTLVALGYHHHVKVISETEDIEEVHACIAWCYLFEKNTSMLLMRPQTLPKLPVPATSYIPSDSSNPMTEFMELSLGIAQAQEAALDLIFAGDQNDNSTWRTEINSILRHMETINSSITSHLASLTDQTDIYVQMHWYILEFTYYSIFTTIIRMDPNMASDHARRKVCLRSARQALECLCKIEASLPGRKDSTQLYLTWAIVSYPLTPLFVVFCNVVCTANLHDFRLLQRTSNALLPIIGANKYIDRLSKLCITLIAMCKPLVDKTPSSSAQASGAPARRVSSDNDQLVDGVSRTSIITDPLGVDLRNGAESLETQSTEEYHFIPGTYDEQGGCFPGSADPSWDDQMMWQLFSTAPSVCWYNADMLDTIRDSSDVFG